MKISDSFILSVAVRICSRSSYLLVFLTYSLKINSLLFDPPCIWPTLLHLSAAADCCCLPITQSRSHVSPSLSHRQFRFYTHPSLFHFRLKTFLFVQIFPTVAFLFFFGADSTDSPDCLPILLSISVYFYFLVFLFPPLFSCWFRAVD